MIKILKLLNQIILKIKYKKSKKKVQKISFEEIKHRFDELDLKYDEFYDYYT